MPNVLRRPQSVTKAAFLSPESGLPEKIEYVRGEIGPFDDRGIATLLANWGADRVIAVTGPEVWREALSAHDDAGRKV
jgi:hypothetical protein